MKRWRFVLVALALAAVALGVFGRQRAQSASGDEVRSPMNVYSAKFLCGDFQPFFGPPPSSGSKATTQPPPPPPMGPPPVGPVVNQPGSYATSINVHNPGFGSVHLAKKAVVSFRSDTSKAGDETPQSPKPNPFLQLDLGSDYVFQIDCTDIRKNWGPPTQTCTPGPNTFCPPPPFLEGFVVIEVPAGVQLDVRAVYTSFIQQNQPQFTPPQGCTPSSTDPKCFPPPPTIAGYAMHVEEVAPTFVYPPQE